MSKPKCAGALAAAMAALVLATGPAADARAPSCPTGMAEVEGEYCPWVEEICARWIDPDRDRCAEYRPSRRCIGSAEPKHYCIDRYEYPNRAGEKPTVAVSWDEASRACAAEGKRLCTASEWTLACEGPERSPYPHGLVRDAGACNFDRPYVRPDDARLRNPATRAHEIARLDQREPSGAREACVSAYGVFDMTGNVDEWVVNEAGIAWARPYRSGLKGGYWGPVRNRCRPMTVDHDQSYTGYQIGFRCCADPGTVAQGRRGGARYSDSR